RSRLSSTREAEANSRSSSTARSSSPRRRRGASRRRRRSSRRSRSDPMHERVASGLTIRAPRNEDVSSIAALLASVEIVLDGRAESTKEDVRFFWSWPGFEVERDAWIVEAEGSFVGYAWVWGPRLPQPDYDARLSLRLPDFPTDAAHLLLDQMEDRVVEKSRAD